MRQQRLIWLLREGAWPDHEEKVPKNENLRKRKIYTVPNVKKNIISRSNFLKYLIKNTIETSSTSCAHSSQLAEFKSVK